MSILSHVSVNLELCQRDQLNFPFLDCGFLFGYGVFETLRVHNGEPFLFENHLTRLHYAATILMINFPYVLSECYKQAKEVIEKNGITDGVLNMYLTPGDRPEGGLEYGKPFFLMVARPLPTLKEDISIEVKEESFQRVKLDQLKTLSYMKNILERRFNAHVDDVVLFNSKGELLESSNSNVFFVKDRRLITPQSDCILPGITRNFIVSNKELFGIETEERRITVDELEACDEVFLTNSVSGVITVSSTENYPHLKSGPFSKRIKDAYNSALTEKGVAA
jgi:branched-subunit amino acid aminotransferase/4-amino-4-deoxychorismate lyase